MLRWWGGSSALCTAAEIKSKNTANGNDSVFCLAFFFILPISSLTVAGYCEAVCTDWRLHCLGQPPAQSDAKVLLSIRLRLFGSCHYHKGINGSDCDERPAERPFYRCSNDSLKERPSQRLDTAAKCRWTQDTFCKSQSETTCSLESWFHLIRPGRWLD